MLSDRSSGGTIVVVGDVMIDRYVTGKVERISPEAPVPVLLHSHDWAVAGGAANVAVNIVALGCDVRLVGAVGSDQNAEDLKEILARTGISSAHLVADAARPTICKTRVVSGRQQFFRIDREIAGRLSDRVEGAVVEQARAAMAHADLVVISDYAKGVFSDQVLQQVIEAAKLLGTPVLVDPKRRMFEAYRGADLIKPNSGELSAASGMPCSTDAEVEAAAAAIANQFDVRCRRYGIGRACGVDGRGPHHRGCGDDIERGRGRCCQQARNSDRRQSRARRGARAGFQSKTSPGIACDQIDRDRDGGGVAPHGRERGLHQWLF